jgi:hypothetical protein
MWFAASTSRASATRRSSQCQVKKRKRVCFGPSYDGFPYRGGLCTAALQIVQAGNHSERDLVGPPVGQMCIPMLHVGHCVVPCADTSFPLPFRPLHLSFLSQSNTVC